MTINQVIEALYRSGVDCGIETLQGAGITAWIVNERNARVEKQFAADDPDSLAEWLRAEGANEIAARAGLTLNATAHSMLAELKGSQRKDAKRVSYYDRSARRDAELRREADQAS